MVNYKLLACVPLQLQNLHIRTRSRFRHLLPIPPMVPFIKVVKTQLGRTFDLDLDGF